MNIINRKHILTIIAMSYSLSLLANDISIESNANLNPDMKLEIRLTACDTMLDEDDPTIYATGNATLQASGCAIKADQIQYNRKTGEIQLLQKSKDGKDLKLAATLFLNKEK